MALPAESARVGSVPRLSHLRTRSGPMCVLRVRSTECEGPGFPCQPSPFRMWWSLQQKGGQERENAPGVSIFCAHSVVRHPYLKHALIERLLGTKCCAKGWEYRDAETGKCKGVGGAVGSARVPWEAAAEQRRGSTQAGGQRGE